MSQGSLSNEVLAELLYSAGPLRKNLDTLNWCEKYEDYSILKRGIFKCRCWQNGEYYWHLHSRKVTDTLFPKSYYKVDAKLKQDIEMWNFLERLVEHYEDKITELMYQPNGIGMENARGDFNSLKLEKFNLQNREQSRSIFILGGRASGKTSLIKKLINGDSCAVFTGCEWEYKEEPFVYSDIERLFGVVKVITNQKMILVIDDMIEESDGIISEEKPVKSDRWEDTLAVQDLLGNSQQFILASRYTLIQNNNKFGYIFIFPDTIRKNDTRLNFLYRCYLENSEIISREAFKDCLCALVDHQTLVIDYSRGKIFYY